MADHKTKKKRGRTKLLTSCFRPFAANRRRLLNDKSDCRNTINGRPEKPITDLEEKDFIPVNDCVTGSGVDCPVKQSGHRRRVSRLLKSVLFDSVMMKKISSSSKPSSQSIEGTVTKSDDSNVCCKEPESTYMEDSSDRSSNLLSSSSRATSYSNSSSSSSSMNSNSQWLSDQKPSSSVDVVDSNHPISSNTLTLQKTNVINSSSRSCFDQNLSSQPDSIHPKSKRTNSSPQLASHHILLSQSQLDSVDLSDLVYANCDKIKSGFNNWNIRWCLLLLISLVVLVMYGRIYSILCTSIWFYLVPCRRLKRVNSASNTTRFTDTESEQYKKRVIMAGLLDRTRNPLK